MLQLVFTRLVRNKKAASGSKMSKRYAVFLFINIIFFQFPVKRSFTYAKIKRSILAFAFMFFECFNYQLFFLIHYIQAFFHFFMLMNIIMCIQCNSRLLCWLI